jgi:hypothetical protein
MSIARCHHFVVCATTPVPLGNEARMHSMLLYGGTSSVSGKINLMVTMRCSRSQLNHLHRNFSADEAASKVLPAAMGLLHACSSINRQAYQANRYLLSHLRHTNANRSALFSTIDNGIHCISAYANGYASSRSVGYWRSACLFSNYSFLDYSGLMIYYSVCNAGY